jgi:hypothetical protein
MPFMITKSESGARHDAVGRARGRRMQRWPGVVLGLLLSLASFGVVGPVRADGIGGTVTPGGQPTGPDNRPCSSEGCCKGNAQGANGTAVGKPVSTYDGSEVMQFTDLTVGTHFPISFGRRYDSRSEYDSAVGYGWSHTYDKRVFEYPDGSIVLRTACGSRSRYVYSGGAYVSPVDGATGQLVSTGVGGFEFRFRDGARDVYDSRGYLVLRVAADGWQQELIYDQRNRLPLIGTSKRGVDPNKPMLVAYQPRLTRIVQRTQSGTATGYALDLYYDETTGRLTKIVADDGREVDYAHDVFSGATRGNLTAVTGLGDLDQTFAYADTNDQHNVTSITLGTGAAAVVNTYDTLDRVTMQVQGASKLGSSRISVGAIWRFPVAAAGSWR